MSVSKKILLLVLILAIVSCLNHKKKESKYKIASSTLPEDVTKPYTILIAPGRISFKGCNYNFATYKL